MDDLKYQIKKMIQLISGKEREKNPNVKHIIDKLERLLLWATESKKAESKYLEKSERGLNGK